MGGGGCHTQSHAKDKMWDVYTMKQNGRIIMRCMQMWDAYRLKDSTFNTETITSFCGHLTYIETL